MPVETLNSNDIGFYVSTNIAVPDFKEIVCGTDISLEGTVEVTKTTTKCGPVITVGDPIFTLSAGGAANVTPTVGTEISATELLTIFKAKQDVLVRVQHRVTPTKYKRQSTAKLTSYSEDLPESGGVTFDLQFDLSGTLATV